LIWPEHLTLSASAPAFLHSIFLRRLRNLYIQKPAYEIGNHLTILLQGKMPGIQQVLHQIELVAPTDASVLIGGESGTGKELIASAIHERSKRLQFSLPGKAVESDIFSKEPSNSAQQGFPHTEAERLSRDHANIQAALRITNGKISGAEGAAELVNKSPREARGTRSRGGIYSQALRTTRHQAHDTDITHEGAGREKPKMN
jgi:transcriptional regulator with GAF, ATPase, and Fis domain